MNVCAPLCAHALGGPEDGIESPGAEIPSDCELPSVVLRTELRPSGRRTSAL